MVEKGERLTAPPSARVVSQPRSVDTVLPVLLAAGTGSRLGGHPKSLIEVAGRRLVDYCVQALFGVGFERLLLVTGHRAAVVLDYVVSRRYPIAVRFLHNDLYAAANNFHSVRLACENAPPGPLLVINCDVIFEPRLLDTAMARSAPLVLLVEEGSTDDEALKVEVSGRSVARLGKNIPREKAFGEFIGLSLLDDGARELYQALADDALEAGETNLYYEDIYSRMCERLDASALAVDPGSWAEIDAPSDFPSALAVAERRRSRAPAASNARPFGFESRASIVSTR